MDSRHGSGIPPWIHHIGPTMAAMAWPRPSPRQLEDLRRSSTSFRVCPSIGRLWWMDATALRGRSYLSTEERLGQRVGRTATKKARAAGLGPVRPRFAPWSLSSNCWFAPFLHVGPWCCLLRGLDKGTCRASSCIFFSGLWSFTASCLGPWVIWSLVHFVSWLVTCFMIFS
jgi:hypothetical protein